MELLVIDNLAGLNVNNILHEEVNIREDKQGFCIGKIFEDALKTNKPVRFLRLAGPKQFRYDVITLSKINVENSPVKYLIDNRIQDIEFILAYPYSNAFLRRMDLEQKDNDQIWRVKEEVLEFVEGLLNINKTRKKYRIKPIFIAFHQTDLFWNLGILGKEIVVARAYCEGSTGHDDTISSLVCKTGRITKIANAFIDYYNFIKNNPKTIIITDNTQIGIDTVSWSSLFKSNVVMEIKDPVNSIFKVCNSKISNKAEIFWNTIDIKKEKNDYFKHVGCIDKSKEIMEPFEGTMLQLNFIEGITGDRFLWNTQKIATMCPTLSDKVQLFMKSIIEQSVYSLKEFQVIGQKKLINNTDIQKYPWEQKLTEAIFEAGSIIKIDPDILLGCKDEIKNLSSRLEKNSTVFFRDAHLKNRMISVDKKYLDNDCSNLIDFIRDIKKDEIYTWLKEHTFDIDFETGFYKVTPWDDLFHIFYFQDLGLDYDTLNGYIKSISKDSVYENEIFFTTMFCRCIREYCRRLWYDKVMPLTYSKRYKIEKRKHFLDCAIYAMNELGSCTNQNFNRFLNYCANISDDIDSFYSPLQMENIIPLPNLEFNHNLIFVPNEEIDRYRI